MKKLCIAICCMLAMLSCTDTSKTSKNSKSTKVRAVGSINQLTVVMENETWKGSIGDTIRKYFGAEVAGLPQAEPLFSMRQMPPEAFTGFVRKTRTFIKIESAKKAAYTPLTDRFAAPQLGAVFSGTTSGEITALIREHAPEIIATFKQIETEEKQHRIRKSLEKIPDLQEKLGITMAIPSAYRVAKIEDDFVWIRKDIPNGNMNLIAYTLPLSTITQDSTTITSIIKMRDTIGSTKIPTGSGTFITEEAYAPYLYETTLDGRFTYETKGTWEIKDRFMAGPFVNYAIKDVPNNRLVVIEGFLFAPSANKRDNMFELEAIIKTVQFK